MRISDWSSDVCSSDLRRRQLAQRVDLDDPAVMALGLRRVEIIVGRLLAGQIGVPRRPPARAIVEHALDRARQHARRGAAGAIRSEEHTSELQSLMRISYSVFCLKKKQSTLQHPTY